MNLEGGLPTPLELAKKLLTGLIWTVGGFLFLIVISSGVQWAMLIGGAILLFFKHFVVGTGLMIAALIAAFIKKSVRLFS
jgi:hypothetical protein